jgi:hypothetical protein
VLRLHGAWFQLPTHAQLKTRTNHLRSICRGPDLNSRPALLWLRNLGRSIMTSCEAVTIAQQVASAAKRQGRTLCAH